MGSGAECARFAELPPSQSWPLLFSTRMQSDDFGALSIIGDRTRGTPGTAFTDAARLPEFVKLTTDMG